jgi:hypothetical protein
MSRNKAKLVAIFGRPSTTLRGITDSYPSMDYQDPLEYDHMDLQVEDMNLVMGNQANALPVHVPYSGGYGLPPRPEMMSTLPIPAWNPTPSRKRRPPEILGRGLSLTLVPGAPRDIFSPTSPIPGQPLSNELIQPQHRRQDVLLKPINPALYYGNPPPCPASWGRIMKSVEPTFKYTEEGELKHDRIFSRSEMREYLYGRQCGNFDTPWVNRRPLPGEKLVEGKQRHGLTLWIGWTPTQVSHRYPSYMSNKCRFADCAVETRTIKSGQLRVAFDERMNVAGKYDPFHCAGYVHLFCLEKHFDMLKLMNDLDVRVDRRVFAKEMKNLSELDAHGLGRIRTAVNWLSAEWPRLKEHEDYIACRRANGDFLTRSQTERPRHFDDSLTKAIQVYDNTNYQTAGRKTRRRRRVLAAEEAAAEGTQAKEICDAEAHMGNLDYVQACNSKRRKQGRYSKSTPPKEVQRQPSWLENPVPPDSYAPWMFTDGFIPSRIERLAPREPIESIAGQYFPRPIYHAPASELGMNMGQPEIAHTAWGPDLIKSEYCDEYDSPWQFDSSRVQPNPYNTEMPVFDAAGMGQPLYAPPAHLTAMPLYNHSSDLDIDVMQPDWEVQAPGHTSLKREYPEDDASNNEGSSKPKRVCFDPSVLDEPMTPQPSGASTVPEGSTDPWARVEPVRPLPAEAGIPLDSVEQDLDLSQYIKVEDECIEMEDWMDDLFDDGSFDFVDLTEHPSPKSRPSPITIPDSSPEIPQSQCRNQGEQPKTALTFSSCRGVKRGWEDDGEETRPSLRRARSI